MKKVMMVEIHEKRGFHDIFRNWVQKVHNLHRTRFWQKNAILYCEMFILALLVCFTSFCSIFNPAFNLTRFFFLF